MSGYKIVLTLVGVTIMCIGMGAYLIMLVSAQTRKHGYDFGKEGKKDEGSKANEL